MARLLTVAVALGCISLLHLQLPGACSGSLRGSPLPARPRKPPIRTPSGLLPRHSHLPAQPQKAVSLALAKGRAVRDGGRRHPSSRQHSGLRRPHAQLMRVGCVLGTCQVQKLSHRLWQLVGPAGQRDSAPMDPSSPHSYG
ncbi:ADM2 [Octodon degus]|uniref:ADM2 n=1 Tax=Octodon degus TaxID=10160 RepID=A0A6P3FPJ5_OCTDE|nr:ADM2 [Octodon degus]